jgi:hypothetical protein
MRRAPALLLPLLTARRVVVGFHPLLLVSNINNRLGIVPNNPAPSSCPGAATVVFLTSSSLSSSSSTSPWEEEEFDDDSATEDGNDDLVWKDDGDEADEMEMEQQQEEDEEEETTTSKKDDLLEEYHEWIKAIEKAHKGLAKKQTSLENEKSKAQTLEGTVSRAQLIVNNLYLFQDDYNHNHNNNPEPKIYQVIDWDKDGQEVELILDPRYESASAEADALFAQARKLKRGSQVIQELLQQGQHAQQVLDECRADLELAYNDNNDKVVVDQGRLRLVQARLVRTASTTQFQVPKRIPSSSSSSSSAQNKSQQSSPNNKDNNNNNKKTTTAAAPALGTPATRIQCP